MHRLTPWISRTHILYAGLALVLAAVGWHLAFSSGKGTPVSAAGVPQSPMVTMDLPPSEPGPLVHVVGAVRHPGVYRLAPEARAAAAVRRAGGATEDADLSALNLAAPVTDGQQVVVPTRGDTTGVSAAAVGGTGSTPVSLSTATAEQLDTLDGIGPTLAQRIVDWRTAHGGFASVDDLLEVPGIGDARLEALRARVTP